MQQLVSRPPMKIINTGNSLDAKKDEKSFENKFLLKIILRNRIVRFTSIAHYYFEVFIVKKKAALKDDCVDDWFWKILSIFN